MPKCQHENCAIKHAVFNLPGEKRGKNCVSHKTSDMVNVESKTCNHDGCSKRPTYGNPGEKATHCLSHKTSCMIDVVSKTCDYDGCTMKRNYGVVRGKPTHCLTHKTSDMVNVVSKSCDHDGCYKRASYAKPDCKATHCLTHKTSDMVDVRSKKCEYEGCNKQCNYGVVKGKPTHCLTHKTSDMVDVKSKTCEYPGCTTLRTYGIDIGKPTHCLTHKTSDMVDVLNMTKTCEFEGCTTRRTYGIIRGKPTHCVSHKTSDMVNVVCKTCVHEGCTTQRSYAKPGQKATHCVSHRTSDMINVISKTCKLCPVIVHNNKYQGYCCRCFIYTFPDSPILRNHKTKERHIVDFLQKEFQDYSFVFDKRVEGGCSNRRPDVLLDMGEYLIIIEIDENQHQKYDCTCENKRLMELFQDCGSRPMTMIRFNPDQYYDSRCKLISSCFGIDKKGLCKVRKDDEWITRLQTLKDTLRMVIELQERKEIDVIHLYYDEISE
jgi:hypothetical protein